MITLQHYYTVIDRYCSISNAQKQGIKGHTARDPGRRLLSWNSNTQPKRNTFPFPGLRIGLKRYFDRRWSLAAIWPMDRSRL